MGAIIHVEIVYGTNIRPVSGLGRQFSTLTRNGLLAFFCAFDISTPDDKKYDTTVHPNRYIKKH